CFLAGNSCLPEVGQSLLCGVRPGSRSFSGSLPLEKGRDGHGLAAGHGESSVALGVEANILALSSASGDAQSHLLPAQRGIQPVECALSAWLIGAVDDIDLSIVCDRSGRYVADALVHEPVTNIRVGRPFSGRTTRDVSLFANTIARVGEKVVRI